MRLLRLEHPLTLSSMANLAYWVELAPKAIIVAVARSKQVCIEWMEATVLLSIYLGNELILTYRCKNILSAECP